MLVGWFRRVESKEGGSRERELGWCFDGRMVVVGSSNGKFRHERRVEIKLSFKFNFFNYEAWKLSGRVLKFDLAI